MAEFCGGLCLTYGTIPGSVELTEHVTEESLPSAGADSIIVRNWLGTRLKNYGSFIIWGAPRVHCGGAHLLDDGDESNDYGARALVRFDGESVIALA